jgi:predicted nucleic acid-binding protein
MRAVLDTSVLIGGDALPPDVTSAISAMSLAELHFGRAMRAGRLGLLEARYPDPLPVDDRVAREWGRLQAAVATRGGRPRRRSADLAIAATANVHGAVLLTNDLDGFTIVADLVDARAPAGA